MSQPDFDPGALPCPVCDAGAGESCEPGCIVGDVESALASTEAMDPDDLNDTDDWEFAP